MDTKTTTPFRCIGRVLLTVGSNQKKKKFIIHLWIYLYLDVLYSENRIELAETDNPLSRLDRRCVFRIHRALSWKPFWPLYIIIFTPQAKPLETRQHTWTAPDFFGFFLPKTLALWYLRDFQPRIQPLLKPIRWTTMTKMLPIVSLLPRQLFSFLTLAITVISARYNSGFAAQTPKSGTNCKRKPSSNQWRS